ncbi:exodeoxyribonuclease V subunit gamma [Thiothrix fructosivorans]|uniref:RecBCD enzyme subunit RecC n=1 Tax=Thiothrix fructosivorans TaxID=111770 RepID=A0A8B0SJX6_9GAMM|nr:exodeoxyribonuclease V subunit gamma [Thiothrix fructosivorans]MBO0613248.1 exodeoxyribonuclease V subunit gamma [Thiothrix fructosivorans]QTX11315.1 exodeoxyribonuclease V subunit gamma [Thiothrix fructosivorans]
MLYLHHSNHLEQLASQFAELQRHEPLAPLQTEQVVVQNSGMGRWLSLQTAGYNGIVANIRYLFPAEMTWELLRMALGGAVPEKDPCAPAVMRWRLLDIFLQEPEAWPELARYLDGGATAAWQLAAQITKVFDQYLFFRPDWIREWEQCKGATDDWQARLWWRVAGAQQLPHWVRLQDNFAAALGTIDRDKLPSRLCFFSVPVLSPGYVQLLGKVAEYIDIHIYLMNPCAEYWGDIETEKRKRKQKVDVQDYFNVGNPLLASWGRQGRDFLDLLIDANALDDDAQFYEPDEITLLGRVQADMLHLRMPELLPSPLDSSIAFHACHSPMREVEVLYDQLLALFAANPDVTPADVVVMTPDIDTYAPYLDAVFSSAVHPLPFSIADRSPGYTQSITNLCEHLLAIPQGRCDVESILTLLEFEEVRTRLGVDEAQVMQCRAWIRAVNIRWGSDAEMRPELGGANTPEHTWRYGLDRLLLGYAMPGDELFGGILPWNEIEGSQAEVLGRLQQVLDAVFELATWAQQQQTVSEWNRRFRYLLDAVVGEDAPLQAVWQALDTLEKTLTQAEFTQPLAWAIYQSALLELLDKRSESDGFLGRGITCCALMPMRTVPFRFVALIGMNDGIYPRRDARASFDRMGQAIKRGDRLKRDEDRYLFLESILSARDWLYISYIGQSPHDNSELPPSVLVSELLDYVERCVPDSRQTLLTKHPLQAFSRKYLRGENGLFTYNQYVEQGSAAQHRLCPPFWQSDVLPEPDPSYRHVSLASLIRFYQQPARFFLKERFGLRLTEYGDELPIREPFGLEKYSERDVRSCIFRQLQQEQPAASAEALLRAQGLLPHGKPGELVFRKEAGITEDFFHSIQPLPLLQRETVSLTLGEFQLSGTLGDLDKTTGRTVYEFDKLSYWNWLDIWLHHLALNTLPESICPHQTLIYTPEKSYQLQAVANAQEQLHQLLEWYWQGLHEPLAFFPKSGFNLMEQKVPDVAKIMSTWDGSGSFAGECEKPEYRLLYRGVNPLEAQEDAFVAIASGVFGQMVSARTG